jgi:signal transduction histidine kinase
MRHEQRESPKAAELDHRSPALRYGAAIGLTVAVTVVAHESAFIWDVAGRHPYLIEWPTVIAASFLGGLGPGLVATAISTAGILFYWIAPSDEWRVQHPSDLMALALFATSGVLVSILIDLLHQARAREKQLRCSRETVLGVVAHDLRNPLATIMTATALIRRRPDDLRRLDLIDRAARRMEHLIRDLVDASALDADGSLSMVLADVPVASLVADAIVAATPEADSRSITISSDPIADLLVRCDRERMLQVLANLLGNAVKFTPEEGHISVRAVRVDSFVRIEVADTGPGIKQEHQASVFERHWSGRTGGAGAGLGLFIARGIVQGHGGRIWLHSEPGRGTTFFLTVPAAVQSNSKEQRAERSERFLLS